VLYLTGFSIALLLFVKLGIEGGEADAADPVRHNAPSAATINAWDLPPFPMNDIEGKQHLISDWKGKVLLVNFWATWCPPCKREIPEFIEYQEQYGSDGLQILGVGIDDPQRLQLSAAELKINYPVLVATAPEMMTVWGNRNQVLPFSAIVDRQGSIRYLHRGQLMPITFERHIKPLLYEQ
jgi:thiol-disulfide isomerase/thioredoxin